MNQSASAANSLQTRDNLTSPSHYTHYTT